jgi:inosine/xanthosine triphosphate pyrophosphatase family protein
MSSTGKMKLIFVSDNRNKIKEVRDIFFDRFVTSFYFIDRPFLATVQHM